MILCRNFILPDWHPKVNAGLYRKNRLERAGFSNYIPVFRPSKGKKMHQRYYLSIKIRRGPRPPLAVVGLVLYPIDDNMYKCIDKRTYMCYNIGRKEGYG